MFNSEYIRYEDRENSDTLIVAFSHVGYPASKFAFSNAISQLECKKLYLNCPDNSWYQRGIPGLGLNISDSASSLRAFIGKLHVKRTIFVGMSMGGYGALLFGLLCDAKIILAFTAEIMIGAPKTRSFTENKCRYYDLEFSNISRLIYKNNHTNIFLVYGEDDLIDLSLLWPISLQILENKKLHFFLSEGAHQCTLEFNIPLLLKTLLVDGWIGGKSIHSSRIRQYDFSVDEFFLYSSIKNFLDSGDAQSALKLIDDSVFAKSRCGLSRIRSNILPLCGG